VTRLRGKGVARKGKEPGDLYVRFLVQLPTAGDADVDRAVDVLDRHVEDPRRGLRF
jgi:curved DNA-binding protein